jgi:NAD(P)-dependent dehydrogenase (short-subunit alcohol dehydrogenase family)
MKLSGKVAVITGVGRGLGRFLALKQSGRLKPPVQVARLAVFLASDEYGAITGEIGMEYHFHGLGYVVR